MYSEKTNQKRLASDHSKDDRIAEGYRLLRRDRDSKGGGILAYINTDFPVSRKTNLESETLENFSVEVHINKNKWLVMNI
jgi:hypothetical protein